MLLDRHMRRFFWWYSPLLLRCPSVFIVIPVIISSILSIGFFRLDELRVLDARLLYTPTDAPSWTEQRILDEHWPLNPYEFLPGRSYNYKRFVLIIATSRRYCGSKLCNLMDKRFMDELLKFDELMAYNVSVAVDKSKQKEPVTYQDLCLGWYSECYRVGGQNGPLTVLAKKDQLESFGIVISYPRANEGGTPVYMAYTAGGVETYPGNNSISYVAAVRLVYFLRGDNETLEELSQEWELAAERFVDTGYNSELIQAKLFHSRSIDLGLQRNAYEVRPKIVLTVVVLIVFTCISMLKWSQTAEGIGCRIDMVRSKPLLALGGIATAGLGIVSGMGLTLLIGLTYVEVNSIMPFLVISIGIDDMFVMVAAWHNANIGEGRTLTSRVQTTMCEAAVSISITSATDALSFAVGSFTSIIAMRNFCINAAVSVCFNWVYQVTFFGALLAIAARFEDEGRNALVPCIRRERSINNDSPTESVVPVAAEHREMPPKSLQARRRLRNFDANSVYVTNVEVDANGRAEVANHPQSIPDDPITGERQNGLAKNELSLPQYHQPSGATQKTPPISKHIADSNQEQSLSSKFFRRYYGPMLLHWATKCVVLVFFLLYITGAIWGLTVLKVGLKYEKLLLENDPVTKYIEYENNYLQAGAQVEVTFSSPPSLISAENRSIVLHIAETFENDSYSIGKPGTQFWLREYLNFLNQSGSYVKDSREMWVDGVYDWVNELYSFYILWSQDIAWAGFRENDTLNIKALRFRIGLKRFHTPEDVVGASLQLRRISARYPQYNISTYQHYRQLADQISNNVPNTVRNVTIAVICMALVALVMLPDPVCAIWVTMAIISIDAGVVGYMAWWNVNLDPISMVTIIMSVGFSVDFAAHITYGFTTSTETTVERRVIDAIEKLAYPVFEGALSTVLGVSVLAFVKSYMVVVFWKTVLLVIVFGAIHALIFLPVLISSGSPVVDRMLRRHSGEKTPQTHRYGATVEVKKEERHNGTPSRQRTIVARF